MNRAAELQNDFPHLAPSAAELVNANPGVRIRDYWSKIFISHPAAEKALQRMVAIRDEPVRPRPRNLLLYGTPASGKTSILREFIAMNPRSDPGEGDFALVPVLYVQAPAKPDEGRFWNNIINALGLICRPTENVARKESLALNAMRGCQVKVLLLDELHNVLTGRLDAQRFFLTVIKNLSNELGIPIIAAGTVDARVALNADAQLLTRFEHMALPDWQLNDDFLQLLASFEMYIPLAKPSDLIESDTATMLYNMSGGIIGELSEILYRAALRATEDGSERITQGTLKKIDWQSPAERRRRSS